MLKQAILKYTDRLKVGNTKTENVLIPYFESVRHLYLNSYKEPIKGVIIKASLQNRYARKADVVFLNEGCKESYSLPLPQAIRDKFLLNRNLDIKWNEIMAIKEVKDIYNSYETNRQIAQSELGVCKKECVEVLVSLRKDIDMECINKVMPLFSYIGFLNYHSANDIFCDFTNKNFEIIGNHFFGHSRVLIKQILKTNLCKNNELIVNTNNGRKVLVNPKFSDISAEKAHANAIGVYCTIFYSDYISTFNDTQKKAVHTLRGIENQLYKKYENELIQLKNRYTLAKINCENALNIDVHYNTIIGIINDRIENFGLYERNI